MADEKMTPAEKAEAAAVRRRWITLGELLAVAAVVISALTFWNSYSERRSSEEARVSEARSGAARARTLILRATASQDGEVLTLSAASDQAIQSQTVTFPSALEIDAVETTNPRIEADWFDGALRKARKDAGQRDEDAGDERLPIAVTTHYLADGGEMLTDVALYDVGYGVKERFLRGGEVRLRGLSYIGRAHADAAQARLDSLWKTRQPTISAGEKK
ncbi:hypothetical protein ACFOMD_14085 [Sphingoaurantiacus capsulatus]|uniref:Uncharacterized protein n=1 Tax=Sphingoaurantiacus capsulatus TaxID=1771310 RepID=A0ABV7XC89_9SPHN